MVVVVALMLASSFVILNDGNVSNATVDDSNWPSQSDYSYKVTYTDASSDLTVLDHLRGDAEVSPWEWNDEGVGPFNMFYAAISTGVTDDDALSNLPGHIAYILDPDDLTHAIKHYGEEEWIDISGVMSDYNIMLVIPTVYWGVSDHAFYLTNVPNDSANTGVEFKAYAHQVDNGTIYPYLAIGVYEATTDSEKGLMSQTGAAPQRNKTLDQFRADVDVANSLVHTERGAKVGTYQVWNFYEWTLYKLLAETYIGSFDSSAKAGGNIYTSAASTTGLGNGAGPVSTSKPSNYGKVLIENAWGSLQELVDNAYVASGKLKAGSGLAAPAAGSISGYDYTGGDLSIGSGGATSGNPIATFSHSAASFGVPLTAGAQAGSIPDDFWFDNGADKVLFVGGSWNHKASAGLSAWSSFYALSDSHTAIGSRLAYLMSADASDSPDFYKVVNYHYNGVGTDKTVEINVNNSNPVTLEVPEVPGYTFVGWYTDPGFDPDTRIEDINVHTDDVVNIFACGTFDTYHVTVPTVTGGSVTASPTFGPYGTSVTFTVDPDDGYRLTSLMVGEQDVTGQALRGECTFTLMDDVQIDAAFETITVAYIDDVAGTDHYPTVANAFAGGSYQVFNIGKDLSEDITVTGTDKTFVLESGKTLTSKVTMTDGPTKAVVDLKGVKSDGELFVYFGSIHINGGTVEGDITIEEGNAVVDGYTSIMQGASLTVDSGSTLSISPGSTLNICSGAIFKHNGEIELQTSTVGLPDGKLVI